MSFDIALVPWSGRGSHLCIRRSPMGDAPDVVLASVRQSLKHHSRRGAPAGAFFTLTCAQTQGDGSAPVPHASPVRLDLTSGKPGHPDQRQDRLSLTSVGADGLAFEATGRGWLWTPTRPMAWTRQPSPDTLLVCDFDAQCLHHFHLAPETGRLAVREEGKDGSIAIEPTSQRPVEGLYRCRPASVEQMQTTVPSFSEVLSANLHQWQRWRDHLTPAPQPLVRTAEAAWHLLWSLIIPVEGAMTRPGMLMSNHWMNQVWSWDHGFNALAIAAAGPDFDPQLAWDQLLLPFDHQTDDGRLPDSVGDGEARFGHVKPPIHGWVVRGLIDRLGLDACDPHLREFYQPLSRWTRWWYDQRDDDGNGMPAYRHGNDSGWDNATIFDQAMPTEGCDLAAFLVIQQQVLGDLAEHLGKRTDAERWRQRAAEQFDRLLRLNVEAGRFISRRESDHAPSSTTSLVSRMPILLGRRLPADLAATIADDLRVGGPFLTDWGLATEAIDSQQYSEDGYWRGPIWAPPVQFAIEGLADAGHTALSRTIAERWCRLCATDRGFWENYDARTGAGLRCPGYSWAAAVYLDQARRLDDFSQMGRWPA